MPGLKVPESRRWGVLSLPPPICVAVASSLPCRRQRMPELSTSLTIWLLSGSRLNIVHAIDQLSAAEFACG